MDEAAIREAVRKRRGEPLYRPVPIVEDATLAQVAAVTARRRDMPDVLVEHVPARRYPADSMAAHVFGYVSEATEAQLAKDGLRAGDVVGQAGFERIYNPLLMGQDGARRVVVNSVGREIRTLDEVPPTDGRRVQLTIDSDLQRAAETAFKGMGYAGAAVVLDPNTGEVLAYTSLPGYDPNAFAAGIDRAAWAALNTDDLKPLQDRAIQGRYSPGSTFKMAVATAALEEGIITPDFTVHCHGGKDFYGRVFKCWNKNGHGTMDLRHAIEQSCDVYFYTLGKMVGVDLINKWATRLGLGVPSGIDLPNEVTGLVPSTEWKRLRLKQPWYPGETISVAIGQGQVSVTPVSMAVHMAALANGGRVRDAAPAEGGGRGKRLEARADAAREGPVGTPARDGRGNPRRSLDGRERGRHGRQCPDRRTRRLRQDRDGAGHLAGGGEEVPGPDEAGPARQCLVRVLRAARQPADCGRRVRRARPAREQRGADDAPHPRDLFREEGREAAAGLRPAGAAGAEAAGGDWDAGGRRRQTESRSQKPESRRQKIDDRRNGRRAGPPAVSRQSDCAESRARLRAKRFGGSAVARMAEHCGRRRKP